MRIFDDVENEKGSQVTGNAPLYEAASKGHPRCVLALLEHKADPDKHSQVTGLTPLYVQSSPPNHVRWPKLADSARQYRLGAVLDHCSIFMLTCATLLTSSPQ